MWKISRTGLSVSIAIVLGTGSTFAPISDASAQEQCKWSGTSLAKDSKFTQQHVIDVGDVPGHQVRILELHRTPSNAKPNCEGLKVAESWNRGYSDYTNLNGRAWGYNLTILENGDKIFGQWSGFNADGTKKTLYTGITTFIGGTGKYRGVRGISREASAFDPQTGFNENEWEAEYWIEK